MKALWRSWADRHAALSRREQIMVAVAVTAAVGFLLMTFWVNPATRRGADLRSGLATRQTELTALDNQIVTLKSQGGKPGEQRGENIYRHGLEVRLAGSYADLLDYVAELERTPQRLLWGGMMLSVTTYPRSELTLTVYTLSRDRDWLAV